MAGIYVLHACLVVMTHNMNVRLKDIFYQADQFLNELKKCVAMDIMIKVNTFAHNVAILLK